MSGSRAKIIAYYLPQYHPTPDNDKWWGKGFTEWTNVAKASPLFKGHYQPKIPADLGFYDLRLPEVREQQAQLARQAGLEGFCYYHYWFGNGKQELELPFNEVVRSGKPDFPFCLCWANESWYAKSWNKDGKVGKANLLIQQEYPGTADHEKHFYALLSALKDPRYIKIENKPVFVIYKPLQFPNVRHFIGEWNSLAIRNGLEGIYFIGYTTNVEYEYSQITEQGFDAVNSCNLSRFFNYGNFIINTYKIICANYFHIPNRTPYKKAMRYFVGEMEKETHVYPSLIPNWDHTPRSGGNGYLLTDSTPRLFEEHVRNTLHILSAKPTEHQICFLKSWNEWGEGNYVEPDLKYGCGYLEALRNAVIE